MPKPIQLQIPRPCHENWQHMTPKEQGRFCGSCQKTIVDFTFMTDKEILDHISKAGQQVCGRFSNDQLNKNLKPTKNKRRFSWTYIWNIVFATFLVTEANAQVKQAKKKTPEVQQPEQAPVKLGNIALAAETTPPRELKGTVIDRNTNQPLANASVYIKNTTIGAISDSTGNFRFMIDKDEPFDLVVSYIGYATQTLTVDGSTNWQDLKVVIPELSYDNITLGMVVVGYKKPKKKIIDNRKPAVVKKDVKVYPNPVVRGGNIHASLSLKKAGEYKLELLNVQGEVMTVQKLMMAANEQVATIPTQGGWAPGIYWVRISAPGVKNVYQCKVSIQ